MAVQQLSIADRALHLGDGSATFSLSTSVWDVKMKDKNRDKRILLELRSLLFYFIKSNSFSKTTTGNYGVNYT